MCKYFPLYTNRISSVKALANRSPCLLTRIHQYLLSMILESKLFNSEPKNSAKIGASRKLFRTEPPEYGKKKKISNEYVWFAFFINIKPFPCWAFYRFFRNVKYHVDMH